MTLIEVAIAYADEQMAVHPFRGLTDRQIDRKYAEWVFEFIGDHGWTLVRDAA